MKPSEWGPPLWKEMHIKTYNYPHKPTGKDKRDIVNYFKNIVNEIPCLICQKHYNQYLREHPVDRNANSRKQLTRWLIDLHNKINVLNGKRVYSYKEVDNYYMDSSKPIIILAILSSVFLILR